MTFHCIATASTQERVDLLREACTARDVAFNSIDSATFNFSQPPIIDGGDMVYRAAPSQEQQGLDALEYFLMRDDVVSLYRSPAASRQTRPYSYIAYHGQNVPIPRTIPHLTG